MLLTRNRWWLALMSLFMLANCTPSNEDGSALIGVSTQALSASDVTKVTITISGPNISPNIVQDLVKTGSQWKGIIGKIPVGTNRTFTAEAFDSGNNKIYSGSAIHTISKGAPAIVNILLQQVNPPNPFQNTVPDITALTASSAQVGNDEIINFTVTANDVDGDALAYNWTASAGTFTAGANSTNATWQAPSASFTGNVTISVEVNDGAKGGKTGTSVVIEVQPHFSTGKAKVSVEFNTWPEVSQMTSATDPVDAGQTTQLDVSASDADGDTLSYAWSATGAGCTTGSFNNANAKNPIWTAPGTVPTSGTCTLVVTVTDGRQGSTTGSMTVNVGAPQAANVAPKLTTTFQSTDTIDPGQTVTFRVVATDPENTLVTFGWTTTNGTFGTANNTGSGPYHSEIVWTAPGSGCSSTITLTATDADGQVTTHDFAVTINCVPVSSNHTIVAGEFHTCGIKNGSLYCWGRNAEGQLGLGHTTDQSTPPTSPIMSNVKQVALGRYFTCAINTANQLFCWGHGYFGQLGNGTSGGNANLSSPPTSHVMSNVKQVTAGLFHTCAINNTDELYCWGYNTSGQLGTGNTQDQLVPPTTPALTNVKQVAAGGYSTCAINTSDQLVCWGSNAYGRAGVGSSTPAAITSPPANAILTNVQDVKVGGEYACALVQNGTLYCWGFNFSGQIGDGTNTERHSPVSVRTSVKQFSAASSTTCAIGTNDALYCWGNGFYGQLGTGINGANSNRNTPQFAQNGVDTISHGGWHGCLYTSGGQLQCWGRNDAGQLGLGNTTNQSTPQNATF